MSGVFGGLKSSVCIDGFEILQSSLHSGLSRTSILLLKLIIQKCIITCTVKTLILQEFWTEPRSMFNSLAIVEKHSQTFKPNGFWL